VKLRATTILGRIVGNSKKTLKEHLFKFEWGTGQEPRGKESQKAKIGRKLIRKNTGEKCEEAKKKKRVTGGVALTRFPRIK